jgi:rubrerythrin
MTEKKEPCPEGKVPFNKAFLMKDEKEASIEYAELTKHAKNKVDKKHLRIMSREEAKHRRWLARMKKKNMKCVLGT